MKNPMTIKKINDTTIEFEKGSYPLPIEEWENILSPFFSGDFEIFDNEGYVPSDSDREDGLHAGSAVGLLKLEFCDE